MRGIKAVLYVAVLVCLISSSFAAINCNNGKAGQDGLSCICKSGYGTQANDHCATLVNGGACVGAELSKTEANHFPSLSATAGHTTFVANTLNARIEAEFVPKRQYDEIKFTPLQGNTEEKKCNLGTDGSFWTQSPHFISGTSCNDSFVLAMPWANHQACGFANNTKESNSEYMFITGYLYIKYTDDLDEVENFTLTRSTKVPYSITVKFQKHVTVKLLALNVSSDVKFGMALTEDVYDPVLSILTLELTTIVNWPNMFYTGKEKTKLYLPEQVEMLMVDAVNGIRCTEPGANCAANLNDQRDTFPAYEAGTCDPQQQDQICKQTFTWKAKIIQTPPEGKNCTFDGEYKLQIGLYTCRGLGGPSLEPDCTNQLVNITYTIQDSFVCGEIGVTPSVSGHLYAFPPTYTSGFRAAVTAHKDINQFKLGTYGHFYAQIDSEDNLISLNFTNIRFKDQNAGTWTNLYDRDTVFESQYIQRFDNSKYFRIYFHSSTFKVNPNSQVVYTFSATCEIAFEGNPGYIASPETKKRTVEYSWTQASAEAQTNVFMASDKASNEVGSGKTTEAGVSSVTFIASVVGAVAGTMIIVFVVVGLALRARSSKEQEVPAALIAASAAASEVANRA